MNAGTGKTFTLNTIVQGLQKTWASSDNSLVAVTATTGSAAAKIGG